MTVLTPDEYLERERAEQRKHEFIWGKMVPTPGRSARHCLIAGNICAAIGKALQHTDCLTFGSGLRVCAEWERLIVYPQVTVVCGRPHWLNCDDETITNPAVLVDVFADRSAGHLGDRSISYRAMATLKEFLFVREAPVWIEHWRRISDNKWRVWTTTAPHATLPLTSIRCDLPVAAIYAGVDLLEYPNES